MNSIVHPTTAIDDSSPPNAVREDGGRIVVQLANGARSAQKMWAQNSLTGRLRVIRSLRQHIAHQPEAFLSSSAGIRKCARAEVQVTEIIPFLEACRFLERKAKKILAGKKLGAAGRPSWLRGVKQVILREPHGLVLVIGPSNYPFFLPGVQILQALVAGNAVLVKPAPGCTLPLELLRDAFLAAGLPQNLFQILSEDPDAATELIATGVGKVCLTGSANTGRAVLTQCAQSLTPATVELSGCDAVFVREDADLDLVAEALRFGLTLNHGSTCVAPRRLFVHHAVEKDLIQLLAAQSWDAGMHSPRHALLDALHDAVDAGARPVQGVFHRESSLVESPLILGNVPAESPLLRDDFFAPVASLVSVRDDEEALAFDEKCPYALGAAVFGRDTEAAFRLSRRVSAGCIAINDLIFPTADPRVPFGGTGRSGFGVTRGAEGLLEMTYPKTVASRRSKRGLMHMRPLEPGDGELFQSFAALAHGKGGGHRLRAWSRLCSALKTRRSHRNPES